MFYRKWWFIVLAVLIVAAGAAGIVWSSSSVLQQTLIRLICSGGSASTADTLASVELLGGDVPYESQFDNGRMDLYALPGDSLQPLILYAHGGYYVGGDKSSLTDYCRMLASFGYVVANINYMLAPAGRYPTQMLQVNEAIAFLLSHADEYGIDTDRVLIAGDSAGAHLSSQMGLYYTNPAFQAEIGGEPALTAEQLRGVILHCGYYDTDTVRATGFPMIADSITMMTGVKDYEGTPVAGQMNTVRQVDANYPAVFIDCGDQDPFITQAEELIAALEKNGVDVTSYLPASGETPLTHEFQLLLNTAEGKEAMNRLAVFLAERCG